MLLYALFSTVACICAVCATTHLYVSSYTGAITTLELNTINGYSLKTVAVDRGSPKNTSYLLLNKPKGVLYSVEEGFGLQNGYLSTYKTSNSGLLTLLDRKSTLGGPVHQVVFNSGKALAVAHYGSASISTWKLSSGGLPSSYQTFTFNLSAPGPNPSRQEASHPHQVVIDPTDSYVLSNDLGADLIRIFSINKATSALTELTSVKAPPGSGPRHGAFYVAAGKTYYFLVCELTNAVISYSVKYISNGLSFSKVSSNNIYGSQTPPAGAGAAEAVVSPDGALLTSSRHDSLFRIPSFSNPSTTIPSDTLQLFHPSPSTGLLTFTQLAPSGGMNPRQFSLNRMGDLAAVGLQDDGRVVIVKRDIGVGSGGTGEFGKFVAALDGVAGGVSCVVWDE